MKSKKKYLEIAVNRPINETFYYENPDSGEIDPAGKRVAVDFGRSRLTGYVISSTEKLPEHIKKGITIKKTGKFIDDSPVFDIKTIELASWISSFYFCSLGQAMSTIIPSGKRGVTPEASQIFKDDMDLKKLNAEQNTAVEKIKKGISANAGESFLLHGITGSGKTEVYRHCAEFAVNTGKKVIILVPEISLTPQTISRFRALFGDRIAVLHSRLTPAQRINQWKKIYNNEVDAAIGARSAVFAPFKDPGLIIIDEEHVSSYKANDCPRYHARQVAFHRTRNSGCLVLGSATPSFDTLYHAKNKTINLLELKSRISVHPDPEIKIIDMSEQPSGGVISPPLIKTIEDHFKSGNQSLLFLNRRGYSSFLICSDCSSAIQCPHCSITMTYHRGREILLCHYCGHALKTPKKCPACNTGILKVAGAGTERIEDFLEKRLPDLRISRVDADTTSKKDSLFKILNDFRNKEIDVLVGTQMITKGLDFPDVTLVGVLSAETEINLPDFRSWERTYNQIIQVIGRCGRAEKKGTAVIQTMMPDADPIKSALTGDAEGFFEREMKRRMEMSYPPFSRMIRIVLRGKDLQSTENEAQKTASALKKYKPEEAELLGPAPCPLSKIAKNYRIHVILKGKYISLLQAWIKNAGLQEGTKSKVYYEIDIDPVSMM